MKARERTTMDETCDTPNDKTVYFRAQKCLQIMLGLVGFLEFLPGNRNHHHLSDDVEYHELQLVCHCEFCHSDLEDENAADGFPRGSLCSTAIQFSDRHSNRSFLLLRIVDLVVDAVDVVDVSVSEIVAFPPREHLAFLSIVLMQRQILVAVEEAFGAHQHSNEESNVWRSATAQIS